MSYLHPLHRPGRDAKAYDLMPARREGLGHVDELPWKFLVDQQVAAPWRPGRFIKSGSHKPGHHHLLFKSFSSGMRPERTSCR